MIYQYIRQLVGNIPAPIFLEIGCHWCEDTCRIFPLLRDPQYHCFEPDPRSIPVIRAHPIYPHIKLFEYALADFIGETEFHLSEKPYENWTASSSILAPALHLVHLPDILFQRQTKVQVNTLDEHCAQQHLDHIDFVWMDAQGAEAHVIRGGLHMLARTRYLYTEYSNMELFSGQQTLAQWLPTLPGTWQVLDNVAPYANRREGDILLQNTSFTL